MTHQHIETANKKPRKSQPKLLVVDAERGADHRRLQVVRDDHPWDTAEISERANVEIDPRRDGLIEDDVHEEVPAEAQRHQEYPRLAARRRDGIENLADVGEVDLPDLLRNPTGQRAPISTRSQFRNRRRIDANNGGLFARDVAWPS